MPKKIAGYLVHGVNVGDRGPELIAFEDAKGALGFLEPDLALELATNHDLREAVLGELGRRPVPFRLSALVETPQH